MRAITLLLLTLMPAFAQPAFADAPPLPVWYGQMEQFVDGCLKKPSGFDLVSARQPTMLNVSIVRGAVDVVVVSSSGNADLDRSAADCYRKVPATVLSQVELDQHMSIPVDWKTVPQSQPLDTSYAPPSPAHRPLDTSYAPPSPAHRHSCDENDYPVAALQTVAEGTTLIDLTVTAEGNVADVAVQNSSGHKDLDDAAVVCAKRWVYAPATKDGVPIASHHLAMVKWQVRATYPFSEIFGAVRSCVMSTETGRKEYIETKPYTVLKMHFSNGAIANATIVGRSGSPDLDRRVLECTKTAPKNLTALVTGEMDETLVNYTNPTQSVTSRAVASSTLACPASYPPEAMRLDESGETTLAFGISAGGAVRDVRVEQSSGYKLLDDAAVVCAQQTWHFFPAFRNSIPVESKSGAIVRWLPEEADPMIFEVPPDVAPYYGAVASCIANTPPPSPDDLARITGPTLVAIDFAHGAVSKATVQASSGNTALDQRALACILGAPKEATQNVPDAQNVVAPVAWKPPA